MFRGSGKREGYLAFGDKGSLGDSLVFRGSGIYKG